MSIDIPRLTSETLVRRVLHLATATSTSDIARQLASQRQLELPLLVIADRQTAGRGRGTNRWWADSGSLTFSVVVDCPDEWLSGDAWPRLSLATALAVLDTLQTLAPSTPGGIRWPNDVYLAGRKICGVLPELVQFDAPAGDDSSNEHFSAKSSLRGTRLVLGIGVNVNNACQDAPAEIAGRAISLFDLIGRSLKMMEVLMPLLANLEQALHDVANHDAALAQRWQQACLLRGHAVQMQLGPEQVQGRCEGIDQRGGLVLETARGRQSYFGGVLTHVH